MEMKVSKLKEHKNVADLRLNYNYSGEIVSPTRVSLNNMVTGKLNQPTKLENATKVAVKVTKISLPNEVELSLLGVDFYCFSRRHC